MRKYLFSAAVLALLSVTACKKDKNLQEATVVDTGDVALGGCGYLLEIKSTGDRIRPVNLPSAYQHHNLRVKVKYDTDGRGDVCYVTPVNYFIETVELTEIKRNLD